MDLNHALRLYELGLSLIPLRPRSKAPDGTVLPIGEDGEPTWKPYQVKRPEAMEILSWFGNGAHRNAAIITGEVYGHLMCIDTDSPETETWAAAHLPYTPMVTLSGRADGSGHHRWYRHPGNAQLPAEIIIDGRKIEIKRGGQYLVSPGSVHPDSGRLYTEAEPWPKTLDDVPEFSPMGLPPDVRDQFLHPQKKVTRERTPRGVSLYDLEKILPLVHVFNQHRHDDTTFYQIRCPWVDEHTGHAEGGTIFTYADDGACGFKCQHSHCADRHWPDFRDRLGIEPKVLILSPHSPLDTAELYVARHHTIDDVKMLRHHADVFYEWGSNAGAYRERDEAAMRAEFYAFLKSAQTWTEETKNKPSKLVPFHPTKSKVENAWDALKAVTNLDSKKVVAPSWLSAPDVSLDPLDVLACTNGLVHIPSRKLYPPNPQFYTHNAIEFAYDPWIGTPTEWLKFLDSIWGDDKESITTLQEWLGYCLTSDTRQQKMLMMVGPPRSGKGVIGRIARKLIGETNTCSPTLASFGRDFGKQPLIDKTLAIISDARISNRTDSAMVAETLLGISGEDNQSVGRKFMEDWHGKLAVRFLMLTNELPRIADVSGALAKRFIVLMMTKTFYGNEDHGWYDRLVPALPAILKWALEGRDALYTRGFFTQPASATTLIEQLEELGSPEKAFLRETTVIETGAKVSQKELFTAWQAWCQVHGRDKPGTTQHLGKSVHALYPWITVTQNRQDGEAPERFWNGLKLLKPPAQDQPTNQGGS